MRFLVVYYSRELTKATTRYRAPCFLVKIVGPHIAISEAVKAEFVMVDRLTSFMWMVIQPNNRPVVVQLAKVFKSLKNALNALIDFHLQVTISSATK